MIINIGGGDWFLNMRYVVEVYFKEREDGEGLDARITSYQLDDLDEEKLMTWHLRGESAEQLRATLRQNQAQRGRMPGEVVV